MRPIVIKFRRIFLFVIVSLFLTSCATIVRGDHDKIFIISEPEGAKVLTDIEFDGKDNLEGFYGCMPTPCTIRLPRRKAPIVHVSKEGYEDIKYAVSSSVATSSASVLPGSIVAGLPPGSYVQVLKPNQISQIPLGGIVIFAEVATYGGSLLVDEISGAKKNLAPKAVKVYLKPIDK